MFWIRCQSYCLQEERDQIDRPWVKVGGEIIGRMRGADLQVVPRDVGRE